MLVLSVVLGATIFGLIAYGDTLVENGSRNSTGSNRTGSATYSVPIHDNARNGTAPVYGGSGGPVYLEEKVGAFEYAQREDSRTLEK